MQLSVFDSAKSSSATVHSLSFDELVEKLKSPEILDEPPDPKRAKEIKVTQAQGWSGALFTNNTRAKKNVQSICLLTYDLDGPRGEGIEKPSGFPYKYVLHTTTSSGFCEPPKGKYRLIFPLARPISAAEYEVLWEKTRRELKLVVDEACKDASRIYFEPIIFREHANRYVCEEGKGPLLGATFSKSLVTKKHNEKYWLEKIAQAEGKYEAVKECAFAIACLRIRAGETTDDVKELVLEALRENERRQSSGPVNSWSDAERQIEGCIERAREAIEAEEADPLRKNSSSPQNKKLAEKALKQAITAVKGGASMQAAAQTVAGFFHDGSLDEDMARNSLLMAWKKCETTKPEDLQETVNELEIGFGLGKANPVGLREGWRAGLRLTEKGGVASGETNVQILVKDHPALEGLIQFRIRAGELFITREPPWEDTDRKYPCSIADEELLKAGPWMARELGVSNVDSKKAAKALQALGQLNQYDSFLAYTGALPAASSTEVLDRVLIEALEAPDDEYTRLCARYWFTSIYARQVRPGEKVDMALILSGPQGLGKSTFFKEIFPEDIADECFADSIPNWESKDVHSVLERCAVVELSELSSMNARTKEFIKAFMSSTSAVDRGAYKEFFKNMLRRTVFGGSTNEEGDYLVDQSGGRRFMPVAVKKLNREWLRKNRDLIWAQAKFYYETAHRWYPTEEEIPLFQAKQAEVTAADPLVEKLEEWLNGGIIGNTYWTYKQDDGKAVLMGDQGKIGEPFNYVMVEQLLTLLEVDPSKHMTWSKLIAKALKKVGWTKFQMKRNGKNKNVWKP